MRTAILALLLTGAASAAFAQPAFAQADDTSVPGRVNRLEKEMRAVQRKVFPGGGNPEYLEPQISAPQPAPAPAGNPADGTLQDLTGRVSALEQQVQSLTNQAEENSHRLTVLEQQYAKMRDDTQFRLNALEGNGGGGAAVPGGAAPANGGTMPPPPATTAGRAGTPAPFGPGGRRPVMGVPAPTMGEEASAPPPPPLDAGTPAPSAMPAIAKTGDPAEDQYMLGYALWTQKRYAEAETQLKQVVAKYPTSKRASYAQNLLGRAYMDDGQLSEAATAFYDGYKKFPRGERAADSLYYLGQTMTRLKKTDRACQVYDELRDVYGATLNATLKARVAQGRVDAKCGA